MKRKIVLVGFLVVLLSVFTCIWLGALHVGAIDAEQISNTEQNTVEMQSSDDELILEEGVYRIRNILKHEYLTVPDFCIGDFSEVRCVADSRRYYQVTKYEKNALWWVSHISGNQYSIRPLHKVNMALDLADDGVSVQIYNVGASISTIYTSRWAVSQPEDWLDSEVYTLCQMNNEDKTLCANSAGTVYTCDYEVSGATGWLFERLDDEQEEELEGIIIYGDFGVKAGSTKRLQAGVFSRTSLSQSVTYSIASGYSGISVTSAGYLTGTSVGPSRVKAVSTVNSRITGYADVAVSSEDDVCATLIGIPSSDEHDHTSYMSNAATCVRGIYGSGSIISKKEEFITKYINVLASKIKADIYITSLNSVEISNKEEVIGEKISDDLEKALLKASLVNKDKINITKSLSIKEPFSTYFLRPNGDLSGIFIISFKENENKENDDLIKFSTAFLEEYFENM